MPTSPTNLRHTWRVAVPRLPLGATQDSTYWYLSGILEWDSSETNCYYRVEATQVGQSTWLHMADVTPKAASFLFGFDPPTGGEVLTFGSIRVTCIDIATGTPSTPTVLVLTLPAAAHVAAANFAAVLSGAADEAVGHVSLTWTDASVWIVSTSLKYTRVELLNGGLILSSQYVTVDRGFPVAVLSIPLSGPGSIPDGTVLTARIHSNTKGDSIEIVTPFSFQYFRQLAITRIAATIEKDIVFSYQIQLVSNAYHTPPVTIAYSIVSGALPTGLTLNGSTGAISGTPTVAGDFNFRVHVSGSGRSGEADASIIVRAVSPVPVVTSPAAATARVGSLFRFQIIGTNNPTSFTAVGLPPYLSINTTTGLITGTPTAPATLSVVVGATNAAGAGTKTVAITVSTASAPVIDISIINGRAITARTGIEIVFQPTASNLPTSWSADPIPADMELDPLTGKLSGVFRLPGLYSVIFVASNNGGDSAPATFVFLIELGPPSALALATPNTDVWMDMQDGAISFVAPPDPTFIGGSAEERAAIEGAKMEFEAAKSYKFLIKRGDSNAITVRFHKHGIPLRNFTPDTIKLGVREDLDDSYVVLATDFQAVPGQRGAFIVIPDFSQNEEINELLLSSQSTSDILDLLAEIQTEYNSLRRSSQSFPLQVERDIVNPD